MSLFERINADIITAYKEKNTEAKVILGLLKSASTKVNKEPTDAEVVAAIKSMIKTHNKSMEEYNAPTISEGEMVVLESLLPKQMSEDELTLLVNEIITTQSLTGPQDMGKVMGFLKNNHGGEYDGKMASEITKELLKSL